MMRFANQAVFGNIMHYLITLLGCFMVAEVVAVTNQSVGEKDYGIRVFGPDISENGAVVPIRVETFGLQRHAVYLKEVQLFICHFGVEPLARFQLSASAKQIVATRIKMYRTDKVIALGILSNGEHVIAEKYIKNTVGGCGGGSSVDLPPPNLSLGVVPDYQARTWLKSRLPSNSARLITSNNTALELQAARIDVIVNGFRARVLLDLEFYNASQVQQQGVLELRLPDYASPHYVAFGDVILHQDDKTPTPPSEFTGIPPAQLQLGEAPRPATLKEGIMVARQQAANAYHTMVSRQFDPALVEWQGSGIYSIRVFPLLPKRAHRALVAYDMDLTDTGNGSYGLQLTGLSSENATRVFVTLDQVTQGYLRKVSMPSKRDYNASKTTISEYHLDVGQALALEFTQPQLSVLHGQDEQTGEYFAMRFVPRLDDTARLPGQERAVFVLDTSIQTGHVVFEEQIQHLMAVLEHNADAIKQFNVMLFDVGTSWWQNQFVGNNATQRKALRDFLYTQNLSGAADLHRALQEALNPSWLNATQAKQTWDVFLYSDGKARWGDTRPRALLDVLNSPRLADLHTYVHSMQDADVELLQLLSEQHHGRVSRFDASLPIIQSATSHRFHGWNIRDVWANNIADVMLSERLPTVSQGQAITVVGRGKPSGKIHVSLKNGNHFHHQQVGVVSEWINSTLAPRSYGETVVRRIEDTQRHHDPLAHAYAHHFRVARATLSLVMLETQEDYQRFNIDTKARYDAMVRNFQASGHLAELEKHHPTLDATVYMAALPANQLQELQAMGISASVCELPAQVFVDISRSGLIDLAPIGRRGLLFPHAARRHSGLQTRAAVQKTLSVSSVKSVVSGQPGDQLAQLRMLSTIMELSDSSAEYFWVAEFLERLGYTNDAYYLMINSRIDRKDPRFRRTLGRIARSQGATTFADILEKISDHGFHSQR